MPVLIRHQWQLKTVVFLHWCLMRAVLLMKLTYLPLPWLLSTSICSIPLFNYLHYQAIILCVNICLVSRKISIKLDLNVPTSFKPNCKKVFYSIFVMNIVRDSSQDRNYLGSLDDVTAMLRNNQYIFGWCSWSLCHSKLFKWSLHWFIRGSLGVYKHSFKWLLHWQSFMHAAIMPHQGILG